MNATRELIETGDIAVVIVDSVAAMVIEKELSIETGGSTFADKAKLMAQTMRQLTPIVKRHDVLLIFVNHLQDVIDATPMGQRLSAQGVKRTTTPGGRALKYAASMRIEYKPIGNVRTSELNPVTNEKEDVPTQTKVQVTVTKNKVGPPFRTCVVRVRFGKGFSQAWTVQDLLVRYKVLKKGTGGVFTLDEDTAPAGMPTTIRGEEKLVHQLETNPEWLAHLTAMAKKLLDEHSHPVAEEPPDEPDAADPELEELLQS
jgi:recombination protein RecA